MRRTSQRGVTLMELVVAISLLGMLSVGLLFAFRIGLNAMSKANDRVTANRKVLGVERVLNQQIAGFIPTKAYCRPSPEAAVQELPFFQGQPQTMRFVSTYSLQEATRGYPRILEYQVIPNADGRGVRLIVNERYYTGPYSTGSLCFGQVADPAAGVTRIRFAPVEIGALSFVLADNLAYCRFIYRDEPDPNAPAIWLPEWVRDSTPTAVRVDFAPLDPDPAKIQLPPITAQFRPNRNAMTTFVDYK